MQKVYFDPVKNYTVIDFGGTKTVDEIKELHGDANYQQVELTKDEAYRVVNGVLEKFDFKAAAASEKAQKESDLADKKNALKNASDFDELKAALLDFHGIK